MSSIQPVDQDRTVTTLLRHVSRGDPDALDALVPVVYDHLRRLAHRALRRERRGHTLSTTALAHEAYARLVGLTRMQWHDRSHFFAVAAQAMRRILVDYAVSRKALKRGGGARPVDLDHVALVSDDRLDEVLMVDQALGRLAAIDPRVVRIVECRVFMDMTIEETASALDLSTTSVKRHWTMARAWLTRELGRGHD